MKLSSPEKDPPRVQTITIRGRTFRMRLAQCEDEWTWAMWSEGEDPDYDEPWVVAKVDMETGRVVSHAGNVLDFDS